MTAFVGRELSIARQGSGPGPAVITGKMTKDISLNNGEIEITSDDDNGFRKLLEASAVRSVDIEIAGVMKEGDLLEFIMEGPIQGSYTVTFSDLGSLLGTFQITDLKMGAKHDDYVSYSCTMKSSGPFSYTPTPT